MTLRNQFVINRHYQRQALQLFHGDSVNKKVRHIIKLHTVDLIDNDLGYNDIFVIVTSNLRPLNLKHTFLRNSFGKSDFGYYSVNFGYSDLFL